MDISALGHKTKSRRVNAIFRHLSFHFSPQSHFILPEPNDGGAEKGENLEKALPKSCWGRPFRGYSTILGTMNRPLACDGALLRASSLEREGRTSSGRVTFTSGNAWA